MSSTKDYFLQAELALASYAIDLEQGVSGITFIKKLVDAGLADSQAKQFSETYSVAVVCNAENGLSATVFKDKDGNQYLAIRGTNDLKDVLTDIVDIALLGSTQLQAQYTSLKAKVTEWIGNGTLSSNFTVTGHSLGGFLATGITADFAANVSHTYLYNTPGVGGIIGTFFSTLGVSASSVDPSKISNLKAEAGPSLIAGLGTQVSTPIYIEIEDQTAAGITNPPAALNHSQQVLTDALAIQSLYATLNQNLTQDQLNALIDASGSNANDVLESALDAVRKLLLGPSAGRVSTNRNVSDGTDLFSNLDTLSYHFGDDQANCHTGIAKRNLLRSTPKISQKFSLTDAGNQPESGFNDHNWRAVA